MSASATADWATSYAAVAWRPFPLVPGGKKPMFTGWQRAAGNPARLDVWFADESRNVGIVAGETFDAFDIEVAHLPAFLAWMRRNDYSLPLTPIADTGRGGRHILVRPTGANGTRRLYLDGVHIGELKSRGGFIVVSPSVTEAQYTWRFAPASMAVAEAPEWLLGLIAPKPEFAGRTVWMVRSRAEAERRLEVLARHVARAERGDRNNQLFWAAAVAASEGIPSSAIASVFERAAQQLIRDDGRRAFDATLNSALEAGEP